MQLKQSLQRAWQHFWWHPITGPVLPMGLLIAAAVSLSYTFGLATGMGNPASFNDVDCKDFATRAEAQEFFDTHGPGDPYWLDFDGDGRACELFTR